MMAERPIIVPLRSTKRRPLPMPKEMQIVCETFGLPMPNPGDALFYTLTRRKEGTEIGLEMGGHWWNLSHLTNKYPVSFEEARKWALAYAERYGYSISEKPSRGRRDG